MKTALDIITAIDRGDQPAMEEAFTQVVRDKMLTALDIKRIALTDKIFEEKTAQ